MRRMMKILCGLLGLVLTVSAFAAEVRTPTQEGVVFGVADGQPLTMDYYAPKGAGPHPIAIIIHGDVKRFRDREFPIRRPNSGPCRSTFSVVPAGLFNGAY